MIINTNLPTYLNDLINARKEKGMSQQDFAKVLGCSNTYLSAVENGKRKPSWEFFINMCDELNLQITLTKTSK